MLSIKITGADEHKKFFASLEKNMKDKLKKALNQAGKAATEEGYNDLKERYQLPKRQGKRPAFFSEIEPKMATVKALSAGIKANDKTLNLTLFTTSPKKLPVQRGIKPKKRKAIFKSVRRGTKNRLRSPFFIARGRGKSIQLFSKDKKGKMKVRRLPSIATVLQKENVKKSMMKRAFKVFGDVFKRLL